MWILCYARQRILLKHQALFSLKNNEKNLFKSSAAAVIGALRVKVHGYIPLLPTPQSTPNIFGHFFFQMMTDFPNSFCPDDKTL